MAANSPFDLKTEVVPLREVESLWNSREQATRLVVQP
jgi:hypothetical protein